jgi:hypothetical protein
VILDGGVVHISVSTAGHYRNEACLPPTSGLGPTRPGAGPLPRLRSLRPLGPPTSVTRSPSPSRRPRTAAGWRTSMPGSRSDAPAETPRRSDASP